MRWDESIERWRLTTNRGDDIRARFVVHGAGSYNRPKLPGIPGIKDFKGHMFHSARWDYDYTGGDASGGLHKLADKRVALVGTGATGVQLVPHLGRDAQHLYVFQRTPSSVDMRGNTPTDPEWATSLQPGWQEERKRNFHNWSPFGRCGVRRAGSGLRLLDRTRAQLDRAHRGERGPRIAGHRADHGDPGGRRLQDHGAVAAPRRGLVDDPETAEALKPYYRFMCKRPCSSESICRPSTAQRDAGRRLGVQGRGTTDGERDRRQRR